MPSEDCTFTIAHAHVAEWEGGFFDHRNDPGGVTMCGVSLLWLKDLGAPTGDIDGDGDIDRDACGGVGLPQALLRHYSGACGQ